MRKRTEHLLVGGYDRTHLIDGLQRQIDRIAEIVPGVEVRGCLCLVDSDGMPTLGTRTVYGQPVLLAGDAARLAYRRGPLAPPEIQQLHDRLAAALRPVS